jgi:hypothetical protein
LAEWLLQIQVVAVAMAVQLKAPAQTKQTTYTMKNWIVRNKLYGIGAVAGALAGFFYWKYIGCLTGTCAITSNPVRSTIYFAILVALMFGMFKRTKEKSAD